MKTHHSADCSRQQLLVIHQRQLRQCERCPDMIRPVITGEATLSKIMLIGQAPGIHEAEVQKPFGWTAGKTLFTWFAEVGVSEARFRERVYMTAICRCFPGKQMNKHGKIGGDRVPSALEIQNCSTWLQREMALLKPTLIIPVGKLAISQFIKVNKLTEVIGSRHAVNIFGHACDLIPLPHPSGASTWHRMEPGKTLLQDALQHIAQHPQWVETLSE